MESDSEGENDGMWEGDNSEEGIDNEEEGLDDHTEDDADIPADLDRQPIDSITADKALKLRKFELDDEHWDIVADLVTVLEV
jgi:hypothetical protein